MWSTLTKSRQEAGFTLVEVAVVVPMIILIVTGIIALLIVLVSNNALQNTRSGLVNDTRFALGSIEKDVDTSNSFFSTALPSATYKDFYEPGLSGNYKTTFGTLPSSMASDCSDASTCLNTLFIQGYSQTIDTNNPVDSTGTKDIGAFKGTAPCGGSYTSQPSNIVPFAVLYFVNNGVLYRRTIIDKTNPTSCGTLLIKQSCPSGSESTVPPCTAKDVELLRNVSQFKIDYYLNAGDGAAMNAYAASPSPAINQAKAIVATITVTAAAGGSNVAYNTSLRMSRLSN